MKIFQGDHLDDFVRACHETFGARLFMILRVGSGYYSNELGLRDDDLVIGLTSPDSKDLDKMRMLYKVFKKFKFQNQLIYRENIPKDLSWYSFLNNGPHIAFELQKAKVLFGKNIFLKRRSPNRTLVKATTLMKLQQYLSEARSVYFENSEKIPVAKMYLCTKRVKSVIKDYLFFYGITKSTNFIEEWSAFAKRERGIFNRAESDIVYKLFKNRPDQLVVGMSEQQKVETLKNIISVMYKVSKKMLVSVKSIDF